MGVKLWREECRLRLFRNRVLKIQKQSMVCVWQSYKV